MAICAALPNSVVGGHRNMPGSEAAGSSVQQKDTLATAVFASLRSLVAQWEAFARGMVDSPRDFLLGTVSGQVYNPPNTAATYWFDALLSSGTTSILPFLLAFYSV